MYPRQGNWTLAQSVAKLEADVTQLKLALRTKVITFLYPVDANNDIKITFTLPADIKTDTVQDIYDMFVDKNDYYCKLACTGSLTVNGDSCFNIELTSNMNYPTGNISGLRVRGSKYTNGYYDGIDILPADFSNIEMHIVII